MVKAISSGKTKIETSNFMAHIPDDQYAKPKWVPNTRFVNPKTYEKLKAMPTEELQAFLQAMKEWSPGPAQ
jgi:hypothetical protein